MNKEIARNYVLNNMKLGRFPRKQSTSLLSINLIISAFTLLMYHNIIYFFILFIFSLINVITSLLFKSKWSACTSSLSVGTQFLALFINLDFVYFSILKGSNNFVFKDFIFPIGIQIFSFFLNFFLVMQLAKRAKSIDPNATEKGDIIRSIGPSIAPLIGGSTLFLSRVLREHMEENAEKAFLLDLYSVLTSIVMCLGSYFVLDLFYRAYLIKKYDLKITLNELGEAIDE